MTNTVEQALKFAQDQAASGTTQWLGMCQKFVRTSYGVGGGFGSAWLQWLGLDDDARHEGTNPALAPLGAPLFYKGTGPYGHVTLAAREVRDDVPGCWSNDLVVPGRIHHVERTRATTQWGQRYLGWGESLNGAMLPLSVAPVTKEKPYAAIGRAIENLERARDTAKSRGDWPDVRQIRRQIRALRQLHSELRK